jgi:hypothetical protein
MVIDLFQPPRVDLSQCSHDDFWLYPGGFVSYYVEHFHLFYEEIFQPSLCSNFDEGKGMVFLEQDFCDESFQPSLPSTRHSAKDMVEISLHDGHMPI